jgi:hypothetical protein
MTFWWKGLLATPTPRISHKKPVVSPTPHGVITCSRCVIEDKTNKLRGLSPSACELYRPSDSRLSAKLVPTFEDRGSRVVSATDPYSRILAFLDWFSSTQLLSCTQEAEWTPFQTHCFSENLAEPGNRTRDIWIMIKYLII